MPARNSRKPGRVLLVENRTRCLKRAAEALEDGGYKVDTAVDAVEAVGHIVAGRPDVILIGKTLRGMDGMTLAMHLKAEPATRDIRILAWMAPAAKGVAEKAAEAGCDGCIAESEDAGSLPSEIDPYFPGPDATATADGSTWANGHAATNGAPDAGCGHPPGAPWRQGLKILVVDDNALSREMLDAV